MVPQKVENWCERNGWTEPVLKQGIYYAFAPNYVIPERIPVWWNSYAWLPFSQYQQVALSLLLLIISYYLTLLLCSFLWQWWGIWSIYISQVENREFLACRYCPLTTGILVEAKDSSQGLFEVESLIISKPPGLVVTNYSGSEKVTKIILQSEVKGRVLYLFESKKFN